MDTIEELREREWLAQRLGMDDVPGSLWTELKDELYVDEALNKDYEGGRDALEKRARRLIRLSQEITSESEDSDSERLKPAPLGDYERERARAFAEYLAKTVEAGSVVQNFRRRILGVEKLGEEQVWELVSSPALGYLSPTWFLIHDMPVLGNQVRIISEERRTWHESVHPAYTTLEADLVVEVELPDGRRETEEIPITTDQQPETLVLPHTKGLPRQKFRVWRPSILGILSSLSKMFSEHYPWREEDAAWFVLTGEVPETSPLAWETEWQEYTDQHAITLTVEPWVSTETVADLYSELRRRTLGRNTRRLSVRNLAVFRFVIAQLEAPAPSEDKPLFGGRRPRKGSMIGRLESKLWHLEGPSWRTLLERWNQAHPEEWSYDDVRLFSRDFYRAHKAIARPYTRPYKKSV
jgi:hypothetical protein